jgi:hypothetical protein
MKFHLRDLLWLTFLVALGLAWWLDRSLYTNQLKIALDKQKDELIRAFVRERNHTEGLGLRFTHPDEPDPRDPNLGLEVPEFRLLEPRQKKGSGRPQ